MPHNSASRFSPLWIRNQITASRFSPLWIRNQIKELTAQVVYGKTAFIPKNPSRKIAPILLSPFRLPRRTLALPAVTDLRSVQKASTFAEWPGAAAIRLSRVSIGAFSSSAKAT